MYVISILTLIIISALLLMIGGVAPTVLIDAPSFAFIVFICLPFLASTGLLKDFNNAFKFAIKTNVPVAKKELKRSITAVSFVIKLLWTAGVFWTAFSIIYEFGGGADVPEGKITAYIAVMALPLIYASFFVFLLLPIRVRLELRLGKLDYYKDKKQKNKVVSNNNKAKK